MPLNRQAVVDMATVVAAETDRLPSRMDHRCMVISQAVFEGFAQHYPGVEAFYIALRWYDAGQRQMSHVAVRLQEGAAAFVVDASWQQYPYVAKFFKYDASTRRKHKKLDTWQRTERANQKAGDAATRVFVGTADQWQALIESYNATGPGGIVRRVFATREAASAWMGFRE